MSEHLKTIETVKDYLNKEEYYELADYIERREIEVRLKENKASNYIDSLVDELK